MTNNSDGLTPTVRPQLGVGFGRVLPAPFGFDDCFGRDVGNGYFSIPNLIGKLIPDEVSFEVYFKNSAIQNNFFQIGGALNELDGFNMGSSNNNSMSLGTGAGSGYGYGGLNMLVDGSIVQHVLGTWSRNIDGAGKGAIYKDGGTGGHPLTGLTAPINGRTSAIGSDGKCGEPIMISRAVFGIGAYGYNPNTYLSTGKWDEFRMYRKCLTASDALLNWNAGIGNNPSNTEHLVFWYKFQSFEMLDFSELQDGSDIRLGMRDHSGNNNHAQPTGGLDTDPLSSGYVLKPF